MPPRCFPRSLLAVLLIAAANSPLRSATVTLTPSADTCLLEPFVDNNAGAAEISSGRTANRGNTRALFKFDVAGNVPFGATITSVQFSVRVTKQPPLAVASTFGVHRALADWGEGTGTDGFRVLGRPALPGECTWNSRFHPSTAWGTPGGLAGTDYSTTASGSQLINGLATFTFVSTAAMVADAQAWLDDPANNFGWFMISQNEATPRTAKRFGSRNSAAASQPSLTVTYDPPVIPPLSSELVAVADTTLFENDPDNNLGGMELAPIGTTSIGTRARTLYRFDLSSIPPNSTVLDATLNLSILFEPAPRGELTYDVHRLLQPWIEGSGSGQVVGTGLGRPAIAGEPTWNNRSAPSIGWGSPGAAEGTDYAATPSASSVLDEVGRFGIASAGLTADVQSWVNNPDSNSGWLVRMNNEALGGTARQFGTRESMEAAVRPSLSVSFEPAPFITSVSRNGNQIRIEFVAHPGRSYAIERRRAFGVGGWLQLQEFPAEAAERTVVATYTMTTLSPIFYRVRTP